ncbi:carboxypeptidase-like regulatory domain-containing protein [Maribacter chungangensis]|uniref:Carboxypeptidase-like regulatory domain-containing protein n=1 Tax=Maribacter chungangensis TaxID=1069117 RepID=A0ABW3B3Q4_9FLAO
MVRKIITLIVCLLGFGFVQAQVERTISGKVSDGKAPMENVTVSILNTNTTTATDKDGFYRLPIATGDELQFSYMGMKTMTIQIEDVTRILNPIMVPDVNELDEVVVTKSRRKSQKDLEYEYAIDPNIIRTAYGYIHAQYSVGHVRILNEKDMIPVTPCVLDLIRMRFPGLGVSGNCFGGGFITSRGLSSVFGNNSVVWDVDGMILQQTPIWLDVNNIKRIAVLPSLGTGVRYGSLGSGGIVVINTVAGNSFRNKIIDRARLRNNYYNDDSLADNEVRNNWPGYKKELYASTSLEAARAKFKELMRTYSNSPYFLLDSQAYFTQQWDRADIGADIIEDYFGIYDTNPVLLKALAYQYQAQGQYKRANDVYKEIFLLRPNYAQSYLDVARSYREVGSIAKAASLHARYDYLLEEGFMDQDTTVFGPIMEREFNNLLALEKDAVLEPGAQNKVYVAENDFDGTRLVFEWNDGEAEFELQFVNPGKQYHTWKHSLADNAESIAGEKAFGYNVVEELIDGSLPGTWQVNVKYLGNKSLTPTYLKATVYYNYGKISQRKEVKVFKLSLKNVNQELFKVQSVSGLATK